MKLTSRLRKVNFSHECNEQELRKKFARRNIYYTLLITLIMLEDITNKLHTFRNEISQLRRGYQFAGEICEQVKDRSIKMKLGLENDLDLFGIPFLLADYQINLLELQKETVTAFECGFGIYVGTHRKTHKFMEDYWNHLKDRFGYIDVSFSEVSSD